MTVPVGADFEHGAKISTSDEHPSIVLSDAILQTLPTLGLVCSTGRLSFIIPHLDPCRGLMSLYHGRQHMYPPRMIHIRLHHISYRGLPNIPVLHTKDLRFVFAPRSSHNTYLLAHQLYGSTQPTSYTHVLSKHCRCVEIDAWDSPEGPKVTHGWTLVGATSFKSVCEAIVASIKDGDWPVMVSLECHAGHENQLEMVRLMKEIWGSRLVTSEIDVLDDQKVTPAHLKGKILLIV
jgi:hypothetical protein